MLRSDLLSSIEIGSSVAEHDDNLNNCFILTDSFKKILNNKVDIISGDKGSGKTAIYKHLLTSSKIYEQLKNVLVISGNDIIGGVVFSKLVHVQSVSEPECSQLWKIYFAALVGNMICNENLNQYSDNHRKLDRFLSDNGIKDAKPDCSLFSKIVDLLKKVKGVGTEIGHNEVGSLTIMPKVELGHDTQKVTFKADDVVADEALSVINAILDHEDLTVWILIDRLDEAFIGYPPIETPALRALLRVYLDMLCYNRVKLKLFIRNDLYGKIIGDSFVNLTHINARRKDIAWDEEDLLEMLCGRIRRNDELMHQVSPTCIDNDKVLFETLFPSQVDVGLKQPTSWKWVMTRICDGKGSVAPRNLIDLVRLGIEEQFNKESKKKCEYDPNVSLLDGDTIKRAFRKLSVARVEDTIMAESDIHVNAFIKMFRGQKSDHNLSSIREILKRNGVKDDLTNVVVQVFTSIGLFETNGDNFKIPYVYREGLGIVRGKAF